jgi:ribonuclease HII
VKVKISENEVMKDQIETKSENLILVSEVSPSKNSETGTMKNESITDAKEKLFKKPLLLSQFSQVSEMDEYSQAIATINCSPFSDVAREQIIQELDKKDNYSEYLQHSYPSKSKLSNANEQYTLA